MNMHFFERRGSMTDAFTSLRSGPDIDDLIFGEAENTHSDR